MSIERKVREIEAIIDQDFEDLDFWDISPDAAIILACQVFEELCLQFDEHISNSTSIDMKVFVTVK